MTKAARVASETGDRSQLDKLGQQADVAARNVAALNRQLSAANKAVAGTGSAMQGATRHFADLNKNVSELGSSLTKMGTRIRNWGAALTAAATGAALAFGKLTTGGARSLDDLDDLAKATGTTTQEIEKLKLVAAAAGDKDFEAMGQALERTTKAMGAAQIEAEKLDNVISFTGGKRDFSDPFKAMDIDVSRFKDPLALLEEFARSLDRESNAAIKASLAAEVFGKGWARVLPTMTNLREEMAAAEKAIVAGGGFTSQQSIEAANNFLAALGRLEQQFGRIRDAAGAQLGAALTPAIQQVTAFIGQNIQQISAWIVNAAGYIKALTQDLTRFFILGQPGQQTEWGAAIINTILYIKNDLIPGLETAFNTVMGVLNQVAGGINATFGTNLTGGQVGLAIVIGQVSGAFNTLALTVTAVATVFVGLLPILGPAGWIIAACIAINTLLITLSGNWGKLSDAVVGAANKMRDALNWVWDQLKKIGSAAGKALSLTGSAPTAPATPMASGGLVPGRGNRDSFPARLMPGEFVIRKSIVAALGADFFAGLNRGMGSLLPRNSFATGGLVVAEPAGGGTPVHLHIGGGSFPLNGAPAVVSALVVEAHRQHIRSAGQKPSWYGGR